MQDKLSGKDKNSMTFMIGSREVFIESGELVKTMDTGADAFTCTMPWQIGKDKELDKITKPFSYTLCGVYIGNDLQDEMVIYGIENSTTIQGTVKKLDCFSKTADIIDASLRYPFEQNNVTLLERIETHCKEFFIDGAPNQSVVVDTGVDVGGKFQRVFGEPTSMEWDHLTKLASQRGLLLSCTKKGELLITKARPDSIPVGTIEEKISELASEYSAKFNGRDRFYRYEAHVTSSKSSQSKFIQRTKDLSVKQPRFLTFSADDNLPGEGMNAAEWRKNKSAADAMSFDFPVNSWYAPNNTLWTPNSTVIIKSQTLNIENGFKFLITQVKFTLDNFGTRATLSIKPPSVYTGEPLEEPWR